MILHSYYKDVDTGSRVYLDDVIDNKAFYHFGRELITATVEFFTGKYKLV